MIGVRYDTAERFPMRVRVDIRQRQRAQLFKSVVANIPHYVARNTVIATPVENMDLYYIDPSDSDFAKLGLNYTTQGETNLIGFHAQGNYGTAVGESYAIMGMALWAEYIDGIAKITFGA